ncbi:DinB family protein, partial [bacterium]|nr:DinB family protein [bacterium]
MTEIEKTIDQLQRAFKKDSWSGPSLQEVLAKVTAEIAAAKPIENAHTIWEIVLHLAAWKSVVRQRIEGKPLRTPEEGDWPAVTDISEDAWR